MAEVEYAKQGRIRVMALNRPEALNALTLEGEALQARYLEEFENDSDARVLIVTGNDRAFSTGLDLKSRGPGSFKGPRPRTLTSPDPLRVTKPIIAAISGYALGGGLELALAADIRIAADNARLGLPEVRHGLIPGAGGMQRLARIVPLGEAFRLLFTGEWIPAEEAYRIGLVQQVVPLDQLMTHTMTLAEKISANAPLAIQAVKEAVTHGQDLRLAEALAYDRLLVFRNRQTEDSVEGVRAFNEKRPAEFKGR